MVDLSVNWDWTPPWEKKGKVKKRVKLTPKERMFVWEHPQKYGRTCSICGSKIVLLSDLELDHKKPHCEGGTKLSLAHRDCNRMKSSGNLNKLQSKLLLIDKTKQPKKRRRKKKEKGFLDW